MDRQHATEIMAAAGKIDAVIVELVALSTSLPDNQEKRLLQRAMVAIVGCVYENMTRHIIRQYPDLDPDKNLRA